MQTRWDAPLGAERVELLNKVSARLAEATSLTEVLGAAVGVLGSGLGDMAVAVVGGPGEGSVLCSGGGRDGSATVRRAVERVLPSLREVAEHEMRARRTFRWVPEVTPTAARHVSRGHPEVLALLESVPVTSLIVVALRTGGRFVGALALARTGPGRSYTAADLALAQIVSPRIAAALEAVRLREPVLAGEDRHGALEEALERWIRVFDLAAWGAAVVDGADHRIEAANAALARMHGFRSADDLVGRSLAELRDASTEGGRSAPDPDPGAPGITYESVHRRTDGTSLPVLVSVTPLTDETRDRSFVVTVQDLTDLKRAEERLRRAQRMEAVGRLAGGVAHEVNNMMTIILGFSDLLGRAPELPAVLQPDVEEIRKAATRAGRISQQLLAFSRQQVLQPADLRINDIVAELVPVLRLLLPANVRVETRLSRVDAVVRADRAQLEQVLINLAFNARDAMPAGGTIRIVTEPRYLIGDAGHRLIGVPFVPGEYALVSVVDTGHGMDEATLEQIFQPFFTTKPVGLGTGLGLATVYGIVKQSGGYVWAESTPGQGTTFTVGLPLRAAATTAADRQVAGPSRGKERGGTLLIVEDEDGVRHLAGRFLAARGYRVLEARNGQEALALVGRPGNAVDLVLTDVVVPDIGSEELARRIREREAEVPILYMSGYPREEVIQRRLVPPDQPFLQKPFTADQLADEVRRVLRRGDPVVGG